jgi:putative oxidoreductase
MPPWNGFAGPLRLANMVPDERGPTMTITTNKTSETRTVEHKLTDLAHRFGPPALRVTLAITFLWFGALKITNDTPVGDFVARTVDWIPGVHGSWFVPFLGVVEVLLGLALLFSRGLRVVLPLLFAHLAGTFLALVTQPEVTFQDGNPVMLTTEGEFVVKNLILLSAVLVLYGYRRALSPSSANSRHYR